MSLYNYFSKLGTITYNKDIVVNILTSVRFVEIVKKDVFIFYPYTIKEGERPDNIAYNYYDDERYAWLVYLSNSIIDPYYQWPLNLDDFNKFLIKKYGSIESSIKKVAFFRNSWYNDDTMLSPAAYGALTSNRKKYWNPVLGYNGAIGSYTRKKEDVAVDTNKVVELTLNSSSNIILQERVVQGNSSGIVSSINGNKVNIIRISGNFTSGQVNFEDSKASRTCTNVLTVHTSIPSDEQIYWEAVSSYDYENELNEQRKNIKLIDKQYVNKLEDQLIELLS